MKINLALVSFCSLSSIAFADNTGWFVTIENSHPNSQTVLLVPGGNDCWYPNDLGTPQRIFANTSPTFYTEEKGYNGLFTCYHNPKGFGVDLFLSFDEDPYHIDFHGDGYSVHDLTLKDPQANVISKMQCYEMNTVEAYGMYPVIQITKNASGKSMVKFNPDGKSCVNINI